MLRLQTDARTASARLLPALLALLISAPLAAQDFFGPVPYTSSVDRPAELTPGAMVIEDFEDGSVDPRLNILSGGSIIGPGGLTDSVDADDGAIDGLGSQGRSWLSAAPFEVEFSAPFPNAAGLVWTDGGSGNAQISFEAFDADDQSLGVIGPFTLGDNNNGGGTAEDRFFGIRHAQGVRRLRLTPGGIEVDHVQYSSAIEPAVLATIEDGDFGLLLPTPEGNLPRPELIAALLPIGSKPHGAAFSGRQVLFADLLAPRLLRTSLADPDAVTLIPLPGRSSGNGSLAVEPNGRYALSIGESATQPRSGEAVRVDISVDPPVVTAIPGGLRVLSFVTAAIDFDPEGTAFVCHTRGVSVLPRPYTQIAFTMNFPEIVQSPSMCRISRDGQRLFVTRVLSETVPTQVGVHTATTPFSAASSFVTLPAPFGVQGLGPMAIAPDGNTLLVGQQFLFPPDFVGTRARAFVLRAPYNTSTPYEEIALPAEVSGPNCVDGMSPIQCPGFEHIEVSDNGSLAILAGNSGRQAADAADGAQAVFIRQPFAQTGRSVTAVQIGDDPSTSGRGAGAVRFLPQRMFSDGWER